MCWYANKTPWNCDAQVLDCFSTSPSCSVHWKDPILSKVWDCPESALNLFDFSQDRVILTRLAQSRDPWLSGEQCEFIIYRKLLLSVHCKRINKCLCRTWDPVENKQSSKSSLFSVPGSMMMCARRLGKETMRVWNTSSLTIITVEMMIRINGTVQCIVDDTTSLDIGSIMVTWDASYVHWRPLMKLWSRTTNL